MIRATLSPVRYMPMVTPPRPWTRFNAGGYLRSESIVMRGHYSLHGPSKKQMLALHHAQGVGESGNAKPGFQPVLDALNVLGKTPWVINDPVLKVMEEVWATGGGKAGVPPRSNLDDPQWPQTPYGLRFGTSRHQMLARYVFPNHHTPPLRLPILVLRRDYYDQKGLFSIPHTIEYSIPFPIPHTDPSYTWSERLTLSFLSGQVASGD